MEHLPEPHWVLDKNTSGHLFWRRDSNEKNSRVKFRHDVQVQEFQRGDHEYLEPLWSNKYQLMDETSFLSMGITCFVCITVTVILPWYIFLGTS